MPLERFDERMPGSYHYLTYRFSQQMEAMMARYHLISSFT